MNQAEGDVASEAGTLWLAVGAPTGGATRDWIFEIAKLRAAKPQAIATGLREAVERNYVSSRLARRASDKMNIPGFLFHALKGKDKGPYSVWVTGNYRITFARSGEDAIDLDLEDYH